jgi:D-alanine-D-alanine ligase
MKILHVAGATTTRFYHELSLAYRRHACAPPGTEAASLTVAPDGAMTWADEDGPQRPVGLTEALDRARGCDLVVPHMFCPVGMTTWRALFEDIAGRPVVGPGLRATALSTSKLATKAIAAAAGVATPHAMPLARDTPLPDWPRPFVVKPDAEDNSLGLTLVTEGTDLRRAVAAALAHGGTALAEAYVPGREVRVGVLDGAAGPRVLPILEYHVTEDHPIRLPADKVAVEGGTVTTAAWERPSLDVSLPADVPDRTQAALEAAALAMHGALGCRDYSLYDFRIDAAGAPWLLEACSFWTFTPYSVISRMLAAEGRVLEDAALEVWRHAAGRKGPAASATGPRHAAE